MRLHIFQHEVTCGPGALQEWLVERGIEAGFTRFYLDKELPPLDDVDALLILGGAMNVYQDAEFSYLKPLRTFTREALHADKRVFGICLGAQIMADALGSRVRRAEEEEKGWIEIVRCEDAATSPLLGWLPTRHKFISWHGDTFDVPAGAVHGAKSATCPAQAFAWGERALALQFHPEADAAIVSGWIETESAAERDHLTSLFLPYETRYEEQKRLFFAALDAWIE